MHAVRTLVFAHIHTCRVQWHLLNVEGCPGRDPQQWLHHGHGCAPARTSRSWCGTHRECQCVGLGHDCHPPLEHVPHDAGTVVVLGQILWPGF